MKESVKAGLRPGWMRSRYGLGTQPPLVGWTGSSERGGLDESVLLLAMMVLAWMVDPFGLDGVDLGSYDANDGSI